MCVAWPQLTHLSHTFFIQGWGNIEKEKEENCKRQRNRPSSVRLRVLETSGTPMKSQPHGCLNEDRTNRHANMEALTLDKNFRNLSNVEAGRK